MNWAKAKTLLIILLLVVNGTLGSIFLFREWQAGIREERALEELCVILAQNGLTVKPEQIKSTLALTYDVERDLYGEYMPSESMSVRGLEVWGLASGLSHSELFIMPVTGHWLWDKALPINDRESFSAGYCLLKLTGSWNKTGILESCELGFTASPIAPDVMRLRPCWRFNISGEDIFFPAT